MFTPVLAPGKFIGEHIFLNGTNAKKKSNFNANLTEII